MAIISSVGTAVPPHKMEQAEVKQLIKSLISDPQLHKYLTVFDEAQIEQRYFVADSAWLKLPQPFRMKNQLWVDQGVELAVTSAEKCINQVTGFSFKDIDAIISITSTGILTPSLDAYLLNRLELREDIKRTPLFGLGCAGGANGLARAFEFLKAYPDQSVLLVAVELASVAFHPDCLDTKEIVASALFGDGAAAVLLLGEKHSKRKILERTMLIRDASSRTKHHSMDVMGWEVGNDGFHVVFDKVIPQLIKPFWQPHFKELMQKHGIDPDQLAYLIVHPGGRKVIEEVGQIVNPTKLSYSRMTLKQFGNMSSPTVLFVLNEVLKRPSIDKGHAILSALGPGFSSELLLLEVV
ncbi:type III polyketide synthase [Alkalibacillus aidingensis]|uniref:type III polyketide synthase n=1 Tax=Alkalibacillus aidingensis TaxID=2747607 RepID=UPI001660FFC2|nr:type III polyketide synthase [Alkalibacillus aidingensis]